MMSKGLHNFFNNCGTVTNRKTYAKDTTNEKIAIDIAEKLQDATVAEHGVFIDYSETPEIEKHIIAYLVEGFGWTLEKPYFIRKPKA